MALFRKILCLWVALSCVCSQELPAVVSGAEVVGGHRPGEYSAGFDQQALGSRAGWLGQIWRPFAHGDQERSAIVRMAARETLLFQGLPGSEEYQRQRLLDEMAEAGVSLVGAHWASFDDLKDYLSLLRARPPSDRPRQQRRVYLIPWQIIPLTYFIYWPVIPMMAGSMILMLPHRESFRFLAALDICRDELKGHPGEIARYGKNLSEASAVKAIELLGLPQGHPIPLTKSRYGLSFAGLLGTVATVYFWLAGSLLSNWRPEVVASPIVPALITVSLLIWTVGMLKPLAFTLSQTPLGQGRGLRQRFQYQLAYRLPVILTAILFFWSSISFDSGLGNFQFRPLRPFAPLAKVARAFREGSQGEAGTQVAVAKRRATPLVAPPGAKSAIKAPKFRGPARLYTPPSDAGAPDADLPEPPSLAIAPQDAQLPTVTELPSPAIRIPVAMEHLILVVERSYEGTPAQLKEDMDNDRQVPKNVAERLKNEIAGRVAVGGWPAEERLRLRIKEPSDGDPTWTIVYLGRPENDPAPRGTPAGPRLGMVAVAVVSEDGKIHAGGFPPSLFRDASGHELTDNEFILQRVRVGDKIIVGRNIITQVEGLQEGSTVRVVGVNDLVTGKPLKAPMQKLLAIAPRLIAPVILLLAAWLPRLFGIHSISGDPHVVQAGGIGFIYLLDAWLFPPAPPKGRQGSLKQLYLAA